MFLITGFKVLTSFRKVYIQINSKENLFIIIVSSSVNNNDNNSNNNNNCSTNNSNMSAKRIHLTQQH